MLKLLFSLAFLCTCNGQNPGFVFSRSISDLQNYLAYLTPSITSNLLYTDSVPVVLNTKDGVVAVVVNITNMTLKDFIVGASNVTVAISAPDWVNVTITGLSCNISYNYTEVGFSIQKTGSAMATISNSKMVMDLGFYFLNSDVGVQAYQSTITVGSIATTSASMSRSLKKAMNTYIATYLGSAAFSSLLPAQLSAYLTEFVRNSDYQVDIPFTNIYMDAHIVYPGITVTDTYVSYSIDGAMNTTNGGISTSMTAPSDLPMRIPPVNASESQVVVSNYTLATYFTVFMKDYPFSNVDTLPPGFPNYLNTSSGYFPELFAAYGSTNLSLNVAMNAQPNIFILSTGLLFRTQIGFTLMQNTTGTPTACTVYNAVVDYQCNPVMSFGYIYGQCYRPSIESIVELGFGIKVSVFNLQRFTMDLIQTSFIYGYSTFFFPVIPMNYPVYTKFTTLATTYYDDFFVIEYLANYTGVFQAN